MKVNKHLIYLLSLYLGFNTLKAQNKDDKISEQDTAKAYIIEETVADGILELSRKEERKSEKLDFKKTSFINAVYSGSNVKALELDFKVQRSIPNFISTFFIQGIPVNELGGFYIGNTQIIGSPSDQEIEGEGISSKFDSKLLSNLNISSSYSSKYYALLGVVKTDFKNLTDKKVGFEIASTPLERYLTMNAPIDFFSSSIAFYADNKEPIWPINKKPATKFIPRARSFQFLMQSFGGNLNFAAFKFFQNHSLNTNEDKNRIKIDQRSNHDILVANYTHDFSSFNTTLSSSYEYWSNDLEHFINSLNNNIDLGTRHYSVNIEAKEKASDNLLGNNVLGFTFSSFYSNGFRDLIANGQFANELFNESLVFLNHIEDVELRGRLRDSLTTNYYNIPEGERYALVTRIVDELPDIYNEYTNSNLYENQDYMNFRHKVYNPSEYMSESSLRSVDVIKAYWDKLWFIKHLLPNDILLNTSLGLNKFKTKYDFIYNANATYIHENLETNVGFGRQISNFERSNIATIFNLDNNSITNEAHYYTVSSSLKLENYFISDITGEAYFKEYNTNRYGKSRGINISFGKEDLFSYRVNMAFGKSEFDGKPLKKSVDRNFNLSTSYYINEDLLAFSKFMLQDGYWSNKNIKGEYKKLGRSVNLDFGIMKTFDVLEDNDLKLSLSAYLPMNNPIFSYADVSGNYITKYAPIILTGQIIFTY